MQVSLDQQTQSFWLLHCIGTASVAGLLMFSHKKLSCGWHASRTLVHVVFPTLRPASRDLLAAFSDSQSFTSGSFWQHIDRIFRHLPTRLPFDTFTEDDTLELSGSNLIRNTRMAVLQFEDVCIMIDWVAWAQYINVTDRQTDRLTDSHKDSHVTTAIADKALKARIKKFVHFAKRQSNTQSVKSVKNWPKYYHIHFPI